MVVHKHQRNEMCVCLCFRCASHTHTHMHGVDDRDQRTLSAASIGVYLSFKKSCCTTPHTHTEAWRNVCRIRVGVIDHHATCIANSHRPQAATKTSCKTPPPSPPVRRTLHSQQSPFESIHLPCHATICIREEGKKPNTKCKSLQSRVVC